MQTSEQIDQLAAAMVIAQGQITHASKDSKNPAFKASYAAFPQVVAAIRGAFTGAGIAIWQDAVLTVDGVAVTTRFAHKSGQWIEFGPYTVPCAKRDGHGIGSATTYAKRQALACAALVPADEDDDANAAVGVTTTQPARQALVKPNGYDDWQVDLEQVATTDGLKALEAAWKGSAEVMRAYVREQDAAWFDSIKAMARLKSADKGQK